MSELTKIVAELEERVNQADEARAVSDRLSEAFEGMLDEIRGMSELLYNLGGEIDGFVAEHDFMAVERAADEIRGITEADRLLPVLRQILLLGAIRDDTAVPDAASIEELPELAAVEIAHPVLSREELLRDSERELAKRETYLRGLWNGEDEADDLEEGLREARLEAIEERALRAGRQLMELSEYIAEELWPELKRQAEYGHIEEALRALAAVDAAGREAPKAYKIYETALSERYGQSPSSMGAMGDHLMLFESWIHSQ
ncbi:coiled-coil domain-containing protein [Actinacidiphila paucisporea]|uniref:Uncharacterized protein n=1 Tax=Actinacidiphila paucisporea TaxID=310782 RepID=A0A1M7PYA6_9ACTN|nr:hypothetical protein [Actinacidiphila paucisporea]SHN22650.1 hypothetical protein SAMN05216499_12726 [Actinacidiphila paucisporea]